MNLLQLKSFFIKLDAVRSSEGDTLFDEETKKITICLDRNLFDGLKIFETNMWNDIL